MGTSDSLLPRSSGSQKKSDGGGMGETPLWGSGVGGDINAGADGEGVIGIGPWNVMPYPCCHIMVTEPRAY